MTQMHAPELTLGHWLREARKRAGRNQAEAAHHLKVSRQTISHWEQDGNDNFPTVVQWKRLAEFYDAPWLWEIAATSSAWYRYPLLDINTQCALTAVG